MNGAVVINKPQGPTSHEIVQRVRRIVGTRSVGHLGTLDPLATGVLPMLIGNTTRLQRFYSARRKGYRGRIRFGFATDTYDSEGHALSDDSAPTMTLEALRPHVKTLTGKIQQLPPAYSAKKVKGVAAYELARRREKFELDPIDVEVFRFDLTEVDGATVAFEVDCASGTYIRSLAHDLGRMTGYGAHLAEITRTLSGEFTLDRAVTLEVLQSAADDGRLAQVVIPSAELLPEMPHAVVDSVMERKIRNGTRIELSDSQIERGADGEPSGGLLRLRIISESGELVAITEAVVPRVYRPIVVLGAADSK